MGTRYGKISGWGKYLPEQRITNHDLAEIMDTTDEWIVRRTGIEARRIATGDETTVTMSVAASRAALAKANLTAPELDLIIVATSTPDHMTPPVSSQIQHALGATNVPAFVLTNACSGFVYALTTAYQFIQSGAYDNILVIGADMISPYINWQDRSTAVLFGDGAGALVLQATDKACGLEGFILGSDGSGAGDIIIPAGGTEAPPSVMSVARDQHTLQMNGRAVFKFATNILEQVTREITAQVGLELAEIDWIIPHQANQRIIQTAARRLGLPPERFITNLADYGNTWAASVPLALAEALDSGQIQPEEKLLLVSFGAGLTWAAALVQMAPVTETVATKNGTVISQTPDR